MMQPNHFAPNTNWSSGKNHQIWWQLTKSFQVAGQGKNRIDFATKNINFTEKDYAETERQLFLDVAEKWLNVWESKKQLQILEVAKQNIDTLVEINRLRFKNQVITQTDLYRTDLLAKQYAIQYKTALQEVITNENALKIALGATQNITVDISDNFLYNFSQNVDSLLQISLENRSDIQAAKSMIDVTESNIKLQKSLAYPRPEVGMIWNPQNTIQYAGIYATISLPFLDRNQGDIKKSIILKDQAEQQVTLLEDKMKVEVSTAFANYKIQQQNIANFETVLQQSKEILENVKYAYLKGGTTIIDFLEAQRSWLETQQQYYETMKLYRQSYVQLFYVTGLINQLAL
jgi:cobalt-zinc-cadmium efflux system outer membrane protein